MRVPAALPERLRTLRRSLARGAIGLRALTGTTRYRRFVVVGTARTGSTMLISLLNAHSQALSFGELFRTPEAIGWDVQPYADYHNARLLALYRADPCRFLDTTVFGRRSRGQRAVGFKLFYYHGREAPFSAVWDYLARGEDIRVLHIKRRNLLAQYLSLRRAHATNRWHERAPGGEAPAPLHLPVEDCRQHFVWLRAREADTDAFFAGHPLLQVAYEDLVADQRAAMAGVQVFLGLREEALSARTVRQRTVPLAQAISNYAELEVAFAGTEWAAFFAAAEV